MKKQIVSKKDFLYSQNQHNLSPETFKDENEIFEENREKENNKQHNWLVRLLFRTNIKVINIYGENNKININ